MKDFEAWLVAGFVEEYEPVRAVFVGSYALAIEFVIGK
jgi:hypothetical protein